MPKPIVGLSSMDGVSDAAMRQITARYGRPALMMTEFTSVDGLTHRAVRLLRDFHYTPDQRPVLAQLYGATPEAFRVCAVLVCALGFDGVDINMGCPACSVARHGSGAGLIRTPDLAKEVIAATRQGVRDWVDGRTVDELGLGAKMTQAVKASPNYVGDVAERLPIPVSVKTRLGFDRIITREWVSHLLETGVDNISIHGRTLAQQYSGSANWDEIARAAALPRPAHTTVLGNGDVKRPEDVAARVAQAGVDGVLIGRGAMGNPWFFDRYQKMAVGAPPPTGPDAYERMRVALEHAQYLEHLNGTVFQDDPLPFVGMRKHFGWYMRDLPGAAGLRQRLYQTRSSAEVEQVFQEFATACGSF